MAIGTLAAIGLGVAGVGSAIGGISSANAQKNAANKAADVSLQTARENNALTREIYGENKAMISPFVNTGTQANALLSGAAGLSDPTAYRNAFRDYIGNSDYGFQFGQGANRINSGFAGAGTLQSGAAMKALEDYRQNLQSGYRNEFNSLLGNQQGVGLSGASALAGVGQNFVNTISANNNAAGTAAANAALAKGSIGNPVANTLSMLGGGILGLAR